MLEKLKLGISWLESHVWNVIGGALVFLFGWLWMLKSENQSLKDQIAVTKAEAQVDETMQKVEEAKNESASSESDYEHVRDEYLSSGGDTAP